MIIIENKEFEGERPLYASRGISLHGVTVHEGESALKESESVEAGVCRFEGRYPFWCCKSLKINDCIFTEESRAPLWYSSGVEMNGSVVLSPKTFRETSGISLEGCTFPKAAETLWNCRDISIRNCSFDNADYLFFRARGLRIDGLKLKGKYTFQYCRDVEIHNSLLDTKDAFWESENVTVYDSEVKGEYLAWYSRNLRLVRCRISGTQPLCYASSLILEDCSLARDADLAFEYSSVEAGIKGVVTSVKNPLTGHITADGFGEIILDENLKKPGNCIITTRER